MSQPNGASAQDLNCVAEELIGLVRKWSDAAQGREGEAQRSAAAVSVWIAQLVPEVVAAGYEDIRTQAQGLQLAAEIESALEEGDV